MRCPECSREKTKVVRGPVGGGLSATTLSATVVLIAINVIMFVGEMASGGSIGGAGGTLVPERLALFGPSIEFNHEYYRMVTYGFLHSGFLHIAFNMWFIWVIGNMLEPALGKVRFVALYFASLLCGAFARAAAGAELGAPSARPARPSACSAARSSRLRSRGIDVWATGLLPIALINFAFTFLFPGHLDRRPRRRLRSAACSSGSIYQQVDRARLPQIAGAIGAVIVAAAAVVGGIARRRPPAPSSPDAPPLRRPRREPRSAPRNDEAPRSAGAS